MLNRFSFGARPGDTEKLVASGPDGAMQWFRSQLNPANINDRECDLRMRDYPTLSMEPSDVQETYPDRGTINRIADGKLPYPSDPQLAAVYEAQVVKMRLERDANKNAAIYTVPPAQKLERKATAARVAGELFAIPKQQRMQALLKMPVQDRIDFATNVEGQQRNTLLADFTPREREYFYTLASGGPDASNHALDELAQARILRDILSERQLQAVMTDFWFNHFNIYGAKDQDRWYMSQYEREVIRRYALTTFPDLLMATATSPAMMVYLDNWLSIGPDSQANMPNGKKGNRGLNENYAREVMELHTVSVNGGYSQADVTSLAAILTGWSVDHPELAGRFVFDPKKHQPGTKQWFGETINEAGAREGIEALKTLAMNPRTAHFISWKLAQRFLADNPPVSVVDAMSAKYLATGGDIKAILTVLVTSPEFNSRQYFRNKVKTPVEFVASVYRTTATDPTNAAVIVQTINQMGQGLYQKIEPTGYYITADHWMNTNALLSRLNFALTLTSDKLGGQKFDAGRLLALGLMSQPTGTTPELLSEETQARDSRTTGHAKAISSASYPRNHEQVQDGSDNPQTTASGATVKSTGTGIELALSVLETSVVGGKVSAQTNQLILQQLNKPASDGGPANADAKLDMLTAMAIGSPEFQAR